MPCTKCENGKYKWGKTGECKYDSKEECEKANPKKYSKMKPTPLGKKSYEEYEKELKEYNLSSTKKFNFGLAQDLEKAVKKSEGLVKTSQKLIDKMEITWLKEFSSAWNDRVEHGRPARGILFRGRFALDVGQSALLGNDPPV